MTVKQFNLIRRAVAQFIKESPIGFPCVFYSSVAKTVSFTYIVGGGNRVMIISREEFIEAIEASDPDFLHSEGEIIYFDDTTLTVADYIDNISDALAIDIIATSLALQSFKQLKQIA